MGFNEIQLIKEKGHVEDQVVDERNVLHGLILADETSHVLQYLEPYGDTVLNHLQMPKFLIEWETVEARATTPDEKALISGVRRLAGRCLEGHHEYLKFVGD